MMNMMMYSVSPSMMFLQCLACLAMLVGAFFLALWAAKTLSPALLLGWGIGLALVGCAVCCLAMGASYGFGLPAGHHMMEDGRMMRNMPGMHDMHDMDDMQGMDHDDMTMGDMSAMLEGKTGDAYDEAFLRMMIPHHQGAIDMVESTEKSAKHEELKQLARDIAAAQQREIDMMNGWLEAWGYND